MDVRILYFKRQSIPWFKFWDLVLLILEGLQYFVLGDLDTMSYHPSRKTGAHAFVIFQALCWFYQYNALKFGMRLQASLSRIIVNFQSDMKALNPFLGLQYFRTYSE